MHFSAKTVIFQPHSHYVSSVDRRLTVGSPSGMTRQHLDNDSIMINDSILIILTKTTITIYIIADGNICSKRSVSVFVISNIFNTFAKDCLTSYI